MEERKRQIKKADNFNYGKIPKSFETKNIDFWISKFFVKFALFLLLDAESRKADKLLAEAQVIIAASRRAAAEREYQRKVKLLANACKHVAESPKDKK